MNSLNYETIRKSKEINIYIERGNDTLRAMGYTDHSMAHCTKVAEVSGHILQELGYDKHQIELAKIAGYMHDIGNAVNRTNHAQSGAILAREILMKMNLDLHDIAIIMNAIGVHDETCGGAVNPVSAALVLADKTDVRRNRVNKKPKSTFDKHDNVNYAVVSSHLKIMKETKQIIFQIDLDEKIGSLMDYFEIFMKRMMMCKRAAEILGLNFKMVANEVNIC